MPSAVVILFITHFTTCQGFLQTPSFLENQLKKYLDYEYHTTRNYTSCSYINVNLPSTRDVSDWFIKYNSCPSVIANDFFSTLEYLPKTEASFIFIEKTTEVYQTLEQIREYPFWSGRGENHFIICSLVNSTDFLTDFFDVVWRKNIINFVVVFVYKHVEILSCNPFKGFEMINFTSYSDDLFPDKLRDLHGYQLRVSLFDDFPLTTKHLGEWAGNDYESLTLITSMMNATFKIIEPPPTTNYDGAYDDIMHDKTDFCFISHFQLGYAYQDAEFTYPHEYNAVALLMPMDFRRFDTFFVFHPIILILFVVLIVTISISAKLGDPTHKQTIFEALMYTSFCLIGNVFPGFNKKRSVIKFQLLTFILGTIIFRTAFQCYLTSYFVSSGPIEQIDSIAELRSCEITLYISIPLSKMVPVEYDLNKKFVLITREQRIEMLYQNCNTSGAYGLTWTYARKIIRTLKRSQKNIPFYVMDEPLVPGYNTYIFQKHSPYLDRISECLLREKQYVLSKSKFYAKMEQADSVDDGAVVLKLHHLRYVFFLHIFVLVVSLIVFIAELFSDCVINK